LPDFHRWILAVLTVINRRARLYDCGLCAAVFFMRGVFRAFRSLDALLAAQDRQI